MYLEESPERYIDTSDGHPIEELHPTGSRYDSIAIKQTDDGIELKAREEGTERVVTAQFTLNEKMYRGVQTASGERRRDLDDDLLDAIHTAGYAVIDDAVERY